MGLNNSKPDIISNDKFEAKIYYASCLKTTISRIEFKIWNYVLNFNMQLCFLDYDLNTLKLVIEEQLKTKTQLDILTEMRDITAFISKQLLNDINKTERNSYYALYSIVTEIILKTHY